MNETDLRIHTLLQTLRRIPVVIKLSGHCHYSPALNAWVAGVFEETDTCQRLVATKQFSDRNKAQFWMEDQITFEIKKRQAEEQAA